MILEEEELIDEITLGSEESEVIEADIDLTNISFILDLVSTKFYSDVYGSIVREIASNSWDANVESGSTKPIVIKLSADKENIDAYIIEFIDNGLGITQERFDKIYRKWFSSSKRLTNNQIGSFGLGSKSCLAYSNYFYIETRCEGFKTKYILSKNNGKVPKIEILSKVEYIGETGTTIRIDIRNASDFLKFQDAVRDQLEYFDNIYIDSFYDKIENDYRIFDCENFKYRSKTVSNKLHLLLGNVKYKINEDTINQGIDRYSKDYIHIPSVAVGIKFNIGQIQVNPNRESIAYSTKSIALIREKILLTIKELKSIFSKQNPVITDFKEYILLRNQKPCITFKDGNFEDKLDIESLGIENKVTFLPLKEVEKLPNNFFEHFTFNTIQNGLLKKTKYDYGVISDEDFVISPQRYYYAPNGINIYGNAYLREGKVITPKYRSFKDLCKHLQIRPRQGAYTNWYRKISNSSGDVIRPTLGSAKIIYKYKKLVHEYLLANCRPYPVPDEEYIKEYKKEKANNEGKKRRLENKLIIVSDYEGSGRTEVSLKSLSKYNVVFYQTKEETELFENRIKASRYRNLIYFGSKSKGKKGQYLYKFITLNKTNLKLAKELPNLRHIDTFYKTPELQVEFNKLILACIWKNEDSYYQKGFTFGNINKVSNYYANLYLKVSNFMSGYEKSYIDRCFEELKQEVKVRNHYRTLQIRKDKKELDKFLEKAEVIKYITSEMPDKYVKLLISQIKEVKTVKLNPKLWQTL